MVINSSLPEPDTPDDDPLAKATMGKSYIQDQLYLFEAAGNLVHITRTEPVQHIQLLEAVVGPLMTNIGSGLERYRQNSTDLQAVLEVHDNLLALGNFAKGFPAASDKQLEALPYTPPFKQMTEALLQALEVMKTRRIVRDAVSKTCGMPLTAGSLLVLSVCYRHWRDSRRACPQIRLCRSHRIRTYRTQRLYAVSQPPHA